MTDFSHPFGPIVGAAGEIQGLAFRLRAMGRAGIRSLEDLPRLTTDTERDAVMMIDAFLEASVEAADRMLAAVETIEGEAMRHAD